MRIGVTNPSQDISPADLGRLVADARESEEVGLASLWMPLGMIQHGGPALFSHDPVSALAAVAGATERIELGTSILPIQHRHPLITAQQALSLTALSGGRFTLGIGNSHRYLVEQVLGLGWESPVAQLRDYLDVLDTLLSGAVVSHSGPYYRVENAQLAGAGTYGTGRPSILVSAMGPEMLKLAGSHTDGTITANTGPRTLESHIVPTIRAAAADAGRPEPRVVATVQLALTSDPDAVRARLTPVMSGYRDMPSYRAMLDREGVEHPVDLVVAGDERTLHAALMRLRDVGVTDVLAAPVDPTTRRATKECLAALAGLV